MIISYAWFTYKHFRCDVWEGGDVDAVFFKLERFDPTECMWIVPGTITE